MLNVDWYKEGTESRGTLRGKGSSLVDSSECFTTDGEVIVKTVGRRNVYPFFRECVGFDNESKHRNVDDSGKRETDTK